MATAAEPLFMVDPQIHPAASLFPMLADDELQDLARDIQKNGQLHPILLTEDGVLVDGRNRLAACNLAGIPPRYETLSKGRDPLSVILSANVKRRQMKPGAVAMVVALMYADREICGSAHFFPRGARQSAADLHGIEPSRFSQAALVIQYAADQVPGVVSGTVSLDTAHAEAKRRKAQASSVESQMARLTAEAPDLAALVIEERLSVQAALAELTKREHDEREHHRSSTVATFNALLTLVPPAYTTEQAGHEMADLYDPQFVERAFVERGMGVTVQRARAGASVLTRFADLLEARERTD